MTKILGQNQFCIYCKRASKQKVCDFCDNELNQSRIESEKAKIEQKKLPIGIKTVFDIIHQLDNGNGARFAKIVKSLPEYTENQVDDFLFELAYEGKLYQPRPDFYKVFD